MRLARGLARAAALLLVGAAAHADPGPGTLEGLMAGMARASGVLAEFHEVKTLALLAAPLESRGVLHFVPPDRMVRRTLEPAPSALVVDGPRVSFRDDSGEAPVDLSGDPSARQFVDNFTTIFRGDLPALREKYEVRFESEPPAWRLVLEPKDAVLRRFVARLTLSGEGEAMREMALVERDGDRTTTHFGRVETNYTYTPAELDALFGPGETGAAAP
jgi:outer membrane lipoprotein-sorting protein